MQMDAIFNKIKVYKDWIVFIFCAALAYCWIENWSYYFFDIIIKFISGIGAIAAGLFVYVKWQDEKTRSLYERSLQEIYAPLLSMLLEEKNRREIYNMVALDPDEEECGYQLKIYHRKDAFEEFFNQNKCGLTDPNLLMAYIAYRMYLSNYCEGHLKGERWFNIYNSGAYSGNDMLDLKCQTIEDQFINGIVNGYNNCLKHLGMYEKRISLEEVLPDCFE